MKELDHSVVEWPPPLHAPLQKVVFGARTVPALKIDGEKISGSRAIMQRLDELVPEPPLYPHDPERRAAVEEADRWGDEVFQPVARELIWAGFLRSPGAMIGYSEHSRLRLPAPVVRLNAPLIARMGARLNRTNAEVARGAMGALPAQLDKIDAWIGDGVLGDASAADLQIASTVRLLLTLADVRPLIAGRPCEAWALGLFPAADGDMPAGSLAAVA